MVFLFFSFALFFSNLRSPPYLLFQAPLPTTTACRIRIAYLPGESSLPSLLYLKPILSYAIVLQQQVEPLSRSHV